MASKLGKEAKTRLAEIFQLVLDGRESPTFDFIVGADGAWSRVRRLLSSTMPLYSGAQWDTVTMRNVTTKYPKFLDLCGQGSMMALGGGHGIMSQRGPQDSIRVYAAISTQQEEWTKAMGMHGLEAKDVQAKLLGERGPFAHWHSSLQDLLATACREDSQNTLANRLIYCLCICFQ